MMHGWKGPIGHEHMTSAEGGGGTTDRLMWCNQATLVVHKHTSWGNNSTVSTELIQIAWSIGSAQCVYDFMWDRT